MTLTFERLKKYSLEIKAIVSLVVTLILGRICLSDYDHPNYIAISIFICTLCYTILKSYHYLDQPPPKTINAQFSNFTSYMQQKYLPSALRIWTLVPLTAVFVIVSGLTLALPVGPLSDEGMILFMEGGCDWGESNVFFFSKLGLLISLNIAALVAMRYRIYSLKFFLLHFIVLIFMILIWRNDTYCDTYYGHPQGNLSQMIFESLVLAFVFIQSVKSFHSKSPKLQLTAFIVVNCLFVIAFYLGLIFADHWTWSHTFITSGILISFYFLLKVSLVVPYNIDTRRANV